MKTKKSFEYPKPLSERSGSKVGWKMYATKKEADVAAAVARKHAIEREAHGYDFGFCSPGSITKLDDGTYGVCVP